MEEVILNVKRLLGIFFTRKLRLNIRLLMGRSRGRSATKAQVQGVQNRLHLMHGNGALLNVWKTIRPRREECGEFLLDIGPENMTECTKTRLRRYCRVKRIVLESLQQMSTAT